MLTSYRMSACDEAIQLLFEPLDCFVELVGLKMTGTSFTPIPVRPWQQIAIGKCVSSALLGRREHPDHQIGIDRRSTYTTVEGCQVLPDLVKVDNSIAARGRREYAFQVKTHRRMQPVRLADVPS